MAREPKLTLSEILGGLLLVLIALAALLYFKIIPKAEAFYACFQDLAAGDPVAIALTGFFALVLIIAAGFWIVDYRSRRKPMKDSKRRKRPETRGRNSRMQV
jgi:hypothetical protein